jgi:hypothetical protein
MHTRRDFLKTATAMDGGSAENAGADFPPTAAEVRSAKPSVNEASFTGQTQEQFSADRQGRRWCIHFPGRAVGNVALPLTEQDKPK